MNRSRVIRLNPTPEQEVYFRKACGVARHAYNWALSRWKDYRAAGKWVKMKDLKAEYNKIKGKQFPWCYEVTKCAPEQEFSHLGQAFDNYWRMKKEGTLPNLKHPRKDGEEGGFPRFKSKKRDRLSFYLANDKFSVDGQDIRIPKLGTVNMTEALRFQGKIMSAVISYRAGWWFVSLSVARAHDIPTHSGEAVGIDLGIKALATCSDGMVFENQRHYRQSLGRIKGLSKGLSRKVEGSQNWWKNTRKLAKAHYRVACQRQDTLHKMTTYLSRNYALIGLENLNTKGMLANHCLARAVSDASFFEVQRQLLYKAEQYGGYVQLVDRWYPSSKTCHACGWIKEDLTLIDRSWVCEQCGSINERDFNASLNIRDAALRLVTDVPVVASSGHKFACGAGSTGSRSFESETDLALKQERRCCKYVLLHFRKQCIDMTTVTVNGATSTHMSHPLDPLSAEEISLTTTILQASGRIAPRMRIMAYSPHEPVKSDVLAWAPGQPVPRAVDVVIRDHERRLTIEALVSLTDGKVTFWRERGDVQPALTYPEVFAAMQAAYDDAAFQQALAKRGITDPGSVVLFPWTAGNWGPEDAADRGRLIRLQATVSQGSEDNYYARPLEGLIVTVELDRMTVRIDDYGVVPLPTHAGNYTPAGITDPGNVPYFPQGTRTDLKPIEITQPEGVSFQVNGHQVSWQKWRFRVGFTPREGLVLHLVEYFDQGRWRPILYRAALSEMYVPYGDPSPTHNFKNVFDTGEVGIGVLANSLELGCDCLGEIYYFDACVNDPEGQPTPIVNAMCMHEEDFSLLWKHLEYNEDGSTRAEVRRSRRLVISMIATVGNYEYGYYWYLYQDGSLQFEVKLTGIIAPAAIAPGEQPISGTLVAPGLYGPNHQHYFNVRIDWMLEGQENSVYEVNCEPLPWGPENPRGNAWVARETLLATESEAQRVIEPRTARYWKIVNPTRRNGVDGPVAYKLVPGSNTFPFFHEGSPQWERGGFVRNHLWVTAYNEHERYAAGDYPNQQRGGDGLPAYVQQNRPLVATDVVTWYTFGSNHVVRSEDWPVMPVDMLGFYLKPTGFFDGNPAIDVSPPADNCDHHPA